MAALINLQGLYAIPADKADKAVALIKASGHRLMNAEDPEQIGAVLGGLAVVASQSRKPELAHELRIMCRRRRQESRQPVDLTLVRSAPFMHRLMVEELNTEGNDETRTRTRDMNVDLVEFYRELLEADGGQTLRAVDPLFLHLIILGASDFFVSAEPIITPLLPPDTDKDELTARFNTFLVDLLLNGLKPR